MMYQLQPINAPSPDGTRFNDPPFNLKELTEKEFAQGGFRFSAFSKIEWRQMLVNDDLTSSRLSGGKMIEAYLFWFDDDTGVAISSQYYQGKVKYYSFGCKHSFNEKVYTPGMQYHCLNCKTEIKQPWMELLTNDTGWYLNENTSIVSRGIRDYNRLIKFSRDLTDDEKNKLICFLKQSDCPGWTGVGGYKTSPSTYKFSTTYDSSD